MLLKSIFITVFKNENPVKLALYYLVWRRIFCACVCVCVGASVGADRSLTLLCSANEEHHLGSYIVYCRVAYNLLLYVNYFIVAFNANVYPAPGFGIKKALYPTQHCVYGAEEYWYPFWSLASWQ